MSPLNLDNYYCVTYSQFFDKINEKIGAFMLNANNKYLTYLIDFMKTINNLERGTTMDERLLELFKKHEKKFIKLIKAVDDLRKDMRDKVIKLEGKDGENIVFNSNKNIYRSRYRESGGISDSLFICDITLPKDAIFLNDIPLVEDRNLAIYTVISPSGWEISIFFYKKALRDEKYLKKLQAFLDKKLGILTKLEDKKLVYKKFDYKAIEDVRECLQEIIDKITEHIIKSSPKEQSVDSSQ